jgi:hypothetical protein
VVRVELLGKLPPFEPSVTHSTRKLCSGKENTSLVRREHGYDVIIALLQVRHTHYNIHSFGDYSTSELVKHLSCM